MKNLDKWINNYIKNVNLDEIEWIKLNATELDSFLEDNYLDRDEWEYVHDENASSLYPTLLGMSYLNINSPINDKEYSFLLGIVDNSIGKKTIVASTIYLDEHFLFTNQEKPITYISTMEVNSFFRKKGIFKKMCKVLIYFVNPNQHVVTTRQTEMGLMCKTFDTLRDTLMYNGFKNYIFEDNYSVIHSELHDIVCSKRKVLKK